MYKFNSRVRYSELASDKKLSLVSIINYFQDCCTFESEDTDVGIEWLNQHRTSWMLTNWQIHILRRPEYCEEIEIMTWASGFKMFMGKRSFLIKTMDGEPLVYALSEWAYVNIDTGRPERSVPDKEVEAYGLATPIEKRFSEYKIPETEADRILKGRIDSSFMKDIDFEYLKAHVTDSVSEDAAPGTIWRPRSIIVSGEHLDTNDHVNNAQYVAFATTQLPAGYRTNIFRAEYKMQYKLGDKIYPIVKATEEGYVVVLSDEEGNTKMVCEFMG